MDEAIFAQGNIFGDQQEKRCPRCEQVKTAGEFYRERGKPSCYCKECLRGLSGRRYKAKSVEINAADREIRVARRVEMIAAYGGRCMCCGEGDRHFLTLDHVGGGGKQHQREMGSGWAIIKDLKRRGWPKDGFQLLCSNCNMGRQRFGGVCPHKLSMEEMFPLLTEEKPPEPTVRLCIECGEIRPIGNFYRHGGHPASYCKPCSNVVRQRYRHAVRDGRFIKGARGARASETSLDFFKRCSKCELWQTKDRFHKGQGWCKPCIVDARNADGIRATDRARTKRTHYAVAAGYGGRCNYCGESNFGFLTIDHVHGDGAKDRKENHNTGPKLRARLIRDGFPRDRYQLLCFNCNCAKGSGDGAGLLI